MHTHRIRRHSGFTLLEMLISVSLGMALVYTALAGFRVLTQAITLSRQMSIENGMLRAGMQLALNEVDFWLISDDPIDPDASKRPMRAGGTAGAAGMPFTPFKNVTDVVTGGPFVDGRPGLDELATSPRGGWNSNPLAWAAWDQRTWNRANLAEENDVGGGGYGYQYWGTFGIYENLNPTESWHHWYGGQVIGLMDALGFWGVYDYMPTNSFLVYHTANAAQVPKVGGGGIAWGGVPDTLLANNGWLGASDGGDNTMKGRIRSTNGSRYFLPAPEKASVTMCRAMAKIGYEGRDAGYVTASVIPQFLADTGVSQMAIPWRPDAWPEVTCDVRRFMEHGHQLTACTVSSFHPLTGTKIVIPFAVVGTSLRGARQQRLSTTGWADPFSGPSLDYDVPNPIPR